jgi:hypothetical protein
VFIQVLNVNALKPNALIVNDSKGCVGVGVCVVVVVGVGLGVVVVVGVVVGIG